MGGVDIADQLRQYYTTQMRTLRNWFPLFLWLLDTAVINAYIMKTVYLKNGNVKGNHRNFRLDLVQELQSLAFSEERAHEFHITRSGVQRTRPAPFQDIGNLPSRELKRQSYVTKNHHTLDPARFYSGNHLPSFVENQLECVWCKAMAKRRNEKSKRERTFVICSLCDVALCCKANANCFVLYHTQK